MDDVWPGTSLSLRCVLAIVFLSPRLLILWLWVAAYEWLCVLDHALHCHGLLHWAVVLMLLGLSRNLVDY